MKIAIYAHGGYKGFTTEPTEENPIIVDAVSAGSNGGVHVKVADLELLDVYSSAVGQAQAGDACPDYNPRHNPEEARLFFMAHEIEVQKFGKVKVRIMHDGSYPFRPEHNRTFPVIVNGYRDKGVPYCVRVNEADARAIGMYVDGFDPTFCLVGHILGKDAEIL